MRTRLLPVHDGSLNGAGLVLLDARNMIQLAWRPLLHTLGRRLVASATTLPTPRGWACVGLLLVGTGLVAVPLGMATGFFIVRPVRDPLLVAKVRRL